MASAELDFFSQEKSSAQKHTSFLEDLERDDSNAESRVEDICRVCRGISHEDRPLFHPCQCTGSIKYVHQDCLVEWLKHSGKQVCELCQYRFEFAPIYREDMPHTLPIVDLFTGMARSTLENLRHWMHLVFVSMMWLFFVPTCIYRIFKFLMYDSMWSIIKLPVDIFSLDNILLDCFHGLLVVLISLLGFISLVWLKDQLGHGLGPNWLEEDRREVNRVVMREAQERVDLLRRHLEEAGVRARERHVVSDRVAVATELSKLHKLFSNHSNKLTDLVYSKFVVDFDRLREKELELVHLLFGSAMGCSDTLRSARRKKYKRVVEKEVSNMTDEELGISYEELTVLKLHDKPSQKLTRSERVNVTKELESIWISQMNLILEACLCCSSICKAMSSIEPLEDCAGELTTNANTMSQSIIIEGKEILNQIRLLKKEMKETSQRESIIIGRQHEEEIMRREVVEARMNRWYNRLLNRHQDDPLVLARRQRRNARRPNIGFAIAGLARERNPMDGDDIGDNVDELTWARLLGLDGSFRFLEHVIWLICLNSALIFGFVYLPFQLGYFIASLFSLWSILGIVNWTGVTSVFIGYCVFSIIVLGFYHGTGRLNKPKVKSALGITFISIKVGMILTVEAGIFPLMCGWWIDICSFSLFNSTLSLRQESMSQAPGTVLFLHWLAGMIFIFYLASFVMLLREVLRPGVLWFLRNLNDQNFHPINEMINLPLQRHVRRFMMSCVLFGVCVVVVLLLPSKIIPLFSSSFLPYKFSLTNTVSPIREIQIELILLQFIIPTLLEHGNCRAGFKSLISKWALAAAKLFGLRSYLLDHFQSGGTVVDVHGVIIPHDPPDNPRYDTPVHTQLQVIGPGFAPFKPYLRPKYFYFRIAAFLLYTVISTVILSTFVLALPVAIGRYSLGLVGLSNAPEMYTASIGLYITWIAIKLSATLHSYASQGAMSFFSKLLSWIWLIMKCLFIGLILFVIIPLMMGHIIELVLLSPIRVPSDKFPVFYHSTEWALGLLHTKCICGLIWLTDINFKHTLDAVYQAGIRNINVTFILMKVVWPVITILSLSMALPYIIFVGIFYSFGILSYNHSIVAYRYFYPCLLMILIMMAVGVFGYIQCRKLYDHVRNEKYLIGRQLVNFKETVGE